MINLEQFMTNLKVSLLRKYCFYGHILAQLPVVYSSTEVPTLGVGKRNKNEIQVKLFVNPDYVEHVIDVCKRDEQKVVGHFLEVLKHEVHHLVFQHLTLDLPDKQRQMIACELADNSYIDRNKLIPEEGQDKAGVFPEDYGLDSKLGVHEYYNLLNDNKKFRQMRNGGRKESEEEKKLDDLAKRQEQASKDTQDGKDTSNDQQDISQETQELLDKMIGQGQGEGGGGESQDQSGSQGDGGSQGQDGSPNGDGSGNDDSQDGEDGNGGIEKLKQARDLQRQAEDALNNGDMSRASKKQHQAAKKLKEAKSEMGSSGGAGSNGQDGNGTLDSHEKWEPIAGDEMTNGMIKDIVRQANETCKQMNSWGDVPGELMDAIDEAYSTEKEIIPWEVVLKDFLASSSENILDYTMKRKSKRYDTRPGTKKDDVLTVAIGIDTSGSIDDELLKIFFNELRWIDRTGTKITVFEWDTQVNREYDFKEFDGTVSGRGGTDPTDFLETVSERKFDCIIIFTDFGFSTIEKRYNKPMMWVVDMGCYGGYWNEGYPVSEGMIMKVNDDRDGFEVVSR